MVFRIFKKQEEEEQSITSIDDFNIIRAKPRQVQSTPVSQSTSPAFNPVDTNLVDANRTFSTLFNKQSLPQVNLNEPMVQAPEPLQRGQVAEGVSQAIDTLRTPRNVEYRPIFGKQEKNYKMTPVEQAVAEFSSRIPELIVSGGAAITMTAIDGLYRGAIGILNTSRKEKINVNAQPEAFGQLPEWAKGRLGDWYMKDGDKFQNLGVRYVNQVNEAKDEADKKIAELGEEATMSQRAKIRAEELGKNMFSAFDSIIGPALDVYGLGASGVTTGLRVTKSNRAFQGAAKKLGIGGKEYQQMLKHINSGNIDEANKILNKATRETIERVKNKHNGVLTKEAIDDIADIYNQRKGMVLSEEAGQVPRGDEISTQLRNWLEKAVYDDVFLGSEQVRAIGSESILGLPGYRTQPGQGPNFGLNIKKQEKVGGIADDIVQEAKKYKSAEEFAKSSLNELNPTGSIFVSHSPTLRAVAPLGNNMTTLDKTAGGSPSDEITIYRGTPGKNIQAGDFITTNKQLAQDYAGSNDVVEQKVKKGDILDDITEPLGEEYIYRPDAFKETTFSPAELKDAWNQANTTPPQATPQPQPRSPIAQKAVEQGRIRRLDRDIGKLDTQLKKFEDLLTTDKRKGTKKLYDQMQETRDILDSQRASIVNPDSDSAIRGQLDFSEKQVVQKIDQAIRQGSIQTKKQIADLQKEVTNLIKRVPLAQRGKFTTRIKDVQTPEQFNRKMPELIADIEKEMTRVARKQIKGKIDKLLKKSKPKKDKSGVLTSTIGPEAQRSIDKMKAIMNASREEVIAKAEQQLLSPDLDEGKLYEELDISMDDARFADVENQTVEQLQETLAELEVIRKIGRGSTELIKEFKKLARDEMAKSFENAIRPVPKSESGVFPKRKLEYDDGIVGTVEKFVDTYWSEIDNIESLAERMTLNKSIETMEGPIVEIAKKARRAISKQTNGEAQSVRVITNKVSEIYGVNIGAVNRVYAELNTKLEIPDVNGKKFDLTRAEAMSIEAMSRDPQLLETFEIMGLNDEVVNTIRQAMPAPDKKTVDFFLQEFFPTYALEGYDGVNVREVFEDLFNTPFNIRQNYFPIAREHNTPVHIETIMDTFQQASTKPGQIKARTNNKNPLKTRNFFEVVSKYVGDMERFKHISPYVIEARSALSHPIVKEALEDSFKNSGQIMQDMNMFLDNIMRGSIDYKNKFALIDKGRSNLATGILSLNLTQLPKQLTSSLASMAEMGTTEWLSGVKELVMNPKKAEVLFESPLLSERYSRSNYNEDIKRAKDQGIMSKLDPDKNFRDNLMVITKFGDMGGLAIGGYPVYRKAFNEAINAGLNSKQAKQRGLEAFEDQFSRTQSSAVIMDLGKAQTRGSWASLWTLFQNTPMQYSRIVNYSLRNLLKGKGSKKKNAKRFFIYWSLLPVLFGLASHPQDTANMFKQNERGKKARTRLLLNSTLGGASMIPFVGPVISSVGAQLAGLPSFGYTSPVVEGLNNLSSIPSSISKEYEKYFQEGAEDGITLTDILESMQDLGRATEILHGLPVKNVAQYAEGALEVFSENGNPLKLMGYSDYALDEGYWEPKADYSGVLKKQGISSAIRKEREQKQRGQLSEKQFPLRDALKEQYEISGPARSEENLSIYRTMPARELQYLLSTYADSTKQSILSDLRRR